ncbi:MAG: hypothetical protein AB7G51_10505 [Steroidobacteraceae bacterium]
MRSRHALSVAALALACLPLHAQEKPGWILEQAIEAQASDIVLPAGAAGTLVVTPCTGCAPRSFVTSPRTRYVVAKESVTLSAMRGGLRAAPGAYVTVFYDARTHEITRVIASGDRQGAQR